MKKDITKAYVALAIVSFFWGTTYLAARIGAQHIPGFFISGVRQFMAGLILVSVFMIKGYSIPEWSIIKRITIQGIFLLCISNGLLTWSVQYINSGLAAVIAALVPLFITLLTLWYSSDARISRWMIFGMLIGLAGVIMIFYDYIGQLHDHRFSFGVVLALVATLSWSFGTVYTSRHKIKTDILFAVGLQMLIAGSIMLVLCGVTGNFVNLASAGQSSLLALGYLIVFGSLLSYSAYVFAITKLPPALVSVYAYINPIVAVGLGWLLLQEKLNGNMLVGTLVTLAGVWLVNRESKKLKPRS